MLMEYFCQGTRGGWTKYSDNPLLGGELGTCFDIAMLQEAGELRMYFSWRDRKSIALTVSTDGLHWSDPVICLEPRATKRGWEDDLNRPSVVRVGSIYHMWYTGQYKPGQADGTSDIFHAVSEDGVRFVRTGDEPVLRAQAPWEKQAVMCPSVLWDADARLFRMWYSGGEQYEPNAIGYAHSEDGLHWQKYAGNPIFQADPHNAWEQHKAAGCQVLWYEGWYRMFYIGYHNEHYAQVGMARSRDGITGWERSTLNPIIAPDPGAWDGEACYKPFVMQVGDRWMLWYNGRKGAKEQIGLAVREGPKLNF